MNKSMQSSQTRQSYVRHVPILFLLIQINFNLSFNLLSIFFLILKKS